jgi:hypothetical protein
MHIARLVALTTKTLPEVDGDFSRAVSTARTDMRRSCPTWMCERLSWPITATLRGVLSSRKSPLHRRSPQLAREERKCVASSLSR